MIPDQVRRLANRLRANRGLGPIPEDTIRVEYCMYCGYVFGEASEEAMEAERGRHRQFCEKDEDAEGDA